MNILPQKYTEFKDKKYWNNFFAALKNTKNEFFEWYGSYSDYRHLLSKFISKDTSIFHVGCGKSTFSQDLFNQNKQKNLNIINCDYSESVIEQMLERTKKLSIKIQYIVCDLLQQIPQKHINNYNLVLDKGTLDAMLPQDHKQNIQKIKDKYFGNMVQVLKNGGKFVIISLLQPFVLQCVVEYFGFKSEYTVDIHQCLISDSKLQPFLIEITKNKNQQKNVRFHPLNSKQIQKWNSLEQVLNKIHQYQDDVAYGGRIKELCPGRKTKFNIFDKNNRSLLRYILEVCDSEDKNILSANTCAVFIVPQGKQNSYLYSDEQGIKSLQLQVKSSRMILVKLITGNTFENLEVVKKQLNSIIPDFVQNGCNVNKVSYLTDVEQLGHKSYLFQNQEVIIDQVLVEGEPIRRFFLRDNPLVSQCQFKLTYLSESNHKHLKQIGSKILPIKKGLAIGIDKNQLFDGNAQYLFSGITYFYGNPQLGFKILIVGCQFALAKFLCENYQNVEITVLCGAYKTVAQTARKYLQLQNTQITIIPQSLPDYLLSPDPKTFNIISLSPSSSPSSPCPAPSLLSLPLKSLLCPPGVVLLQYSNYPCVPMLQEFFPVYCVEAEPKTQSILFCLNHNKVQKDGKILVNKKLVSPKPLCEPLFDWQFDIYKDITIIQPLLTHDRKGFQDEKYVIDDGEFEDVYGKGDHDGEKKANKKKKKKK